VEKLVLDYKKDPDYDKLFDSIHNMLMDLFNAEMSAFDEELFSGIDPSAAKTIQLVSSNFNIEIALLISDYTCELDRMKVSGQAMMDTPTFILQYALNEGTWSLIFRKLLGMMIEGKLKNILKLDNLIWNTGGSTAEDRVYYLVEFKQITDNYITPLYNRWLKEHPGEDHEILARRMISGVYNVSSIASDQIYEGSKRVLRSKLDYLEDDSTADSYPPWATEAHELYKSLQHYYKNEEYHGELNLYLITTALIQREILIDKHKKRRKTAAKIKKLGNYSELVYNLGWDKLDHNNLHSVEEFKARVVNELYNRQEESPIEAAQNLLLDILNGISLHKITILKIVDSFQFIIDKKKSTVQDPIERDSILVETIQEQLPNILIKLRSNPEIIKKETAREDVQDLPIWNSFEENFKRVKRLKDKGLSYPLITKLITSTYKIIIAKSYPPDDTAYIILDKFNERFPEFTVSEYKTEINKIISVYNVGTRSLPQVDSKIIDYLSFVLHELFYN
jgi:hypothetical protein